MADYDHYYFLSLFKMNPKEAKPLYLIAQSLAIYCTNNTKCTSPNYCNKWTTGHFLFISSTTPKY